MLKCHQPRGRRGANLCTKGTQTRSTSGEGGAINYDDDDDSYVNDDDDDDNNDHDADLEKHFFVNSETLGVQIWRKNA